MRDPKEYYDSIGEKEWKRLSKDPYHMLEFDITMHFLKKYLPRQGRVLDAGGGPGRYSIELAKMGFEVVLQDVSPEQLRIARQKIQECDEQVANRVTRIVEGSITDLSGFDDESFDSVLCLGSISHLTRESERKTAAGELVRVLRENSPVFVSGIGRFAVFRTILRDLPGELADPDHLAMLRTGVHHGHMISEDGKDYRKSTSFPDAYFLTPGDLPKLFEEYGIETLELVSCEGLSSHLKEATNLLFEDKDKWEIWFQILLDTCTEPSIVGMGEHILYVGKK